MPGLVGGLCLCGSALDDALILGAAPEGAEAQLAVERQTGFGGHQRHGASGMGLQHVSEQPVAESLSLPFAGDDHQPQIGMGIAPVPAEGGADQLLSMEQAAGQTVRVGPADETGPVLGPVGPAQLLGQGMGCRGVGRGQWQDSGCFHHEKRALRPCVRLERIIPDLPAC